MQHKIFATNPDADKDQRTKIQRSEEKSVKLNASQEDRTRARETQALGSKSGSSSLPLGSLTKRTIKNRAIVYLEQYF